MASAAVSVERVEEKQTGAALAFLYEHPRWFEPLFAELERRGLAFDKLYAPDHFYAVEGGGAPEFKVLFNRMSPSADRRGMGRGLYHTLSWLGHLELQGVRVLNGVKAFQFELSKALQHSLIQSLGLRGLPTRVVHRAEQAVAAAEGLRFPIVVKPNVGGSGAGIVKYETPEALADAVRAGELALGYDSIALVQEFVPARGGYITRVETLGGKYLYAIQVHLTGQTFDLCPADICQTTRGEALAEGLNSACVLDAAKSGLKVEGYTPPPEVIAAIEQIVQAAGIDVGGIEYMVDDRDGEIYFYDVNALSNFVADPLRVIGFDPFARLADFRKPRWRVPGKRIRFGYWMPVFGGWLRNVEDEGMDASWAYTSRLARRSEELGFDLSLIAELNLNDIKGVDAPSLDAWSTAAALAAVTTTLELMVAVRPTFHQPALFAKQAANVDHISGGRLALNVVSSWWEQEARMYGVGFERHDDRYGRTSEWLDVVNGAWSEPVFDHAGRYYTTEGTVLEPKPVRKPRPPIYAGGESEAAKNLIAAKCDAYVMHGDSPGHVGAKIAEMRERRERLGLPPMQFGVAGYAFTRENEAAVAAELGRITDVQQNAKGFANYQQWLAGTQLERTMSIEEYSVSNRGLRSGLTGTPAQVQDKIGEFERVGVDLLLLQFSPQMEEMERFSETVLHASVRTLFEETP